MFVFGHTGLTLGSVMLLEVFLSKGSRGKVTEIADGEVSRASVSLPAQKRRDSSRLLKHIADLIDIRVLLIGSILPDIIDKPIGRFLFTDTFDNGRIFSHTLLFLVIVTAGGWLLFRISHKPWLLVLAYGIFTHLVLDGMWLYPHTLFWPLYGFSFEKYPPDLWSQVADILRELLTNPRLLISEITGAVVIIWLVWRLVRRQKLLSFLKSGRI